MENGAENNIRLGNAEMKVTGHTVIPFVFECILSSVKLGINSLSAFISGGTMINAM